MYTHTETCTKTNREVKKCRLDDGTVMDLDAVQDMVLVTPGEVSSCGYEKETFAIGSRG